MIHINCVQTTFWDVDDTLVMWNPTPEQLEKYGVTCLAPGALFINHFNEIEQGKPSEIKILPHRVHIEQLIKHKQRGHTNVVWSAGGSTWAATAVKALGIQDYVDLVIAKPIWYYDDKKAEDFMGKPSFIKDRE